LRREFTDWDFSAVPVGQPWWYVHGRSTQARVIGDAATKGQCDLLSNTASLDDPAQQDASSGDTVSKVGVDGRGMSELETGGGISKNVDSSVAVAASVKPTAPQPADGGYSISDTNTSLPVAAEAEEHAPYVEWRPEGRYCCEGEPKEVFARRMATLREYLRQRPERHLAVVAHWGVLKALTGREFENCEVRVVKMSEFLPEPLVTDT
jgi:hypothetical protein